MGNCAKVCCPFNSAACHSNGTVSNYGSCSTIKGQCQGLVFCKKRHDAQKVSLALKGSALHFHYSIASLTLVQESEHSVFRSQYCLCFVFLVWCVSELFWKAAVPYCFPDIPFLWSGSCHPQWIWGGAGRRSWRISGNLIRNSCFGTGGVGILLQCLFKYTGGAINYVWPPLVYNSGPLCICGEEIMVLGAFSMFTLEISLNSFYSSLYALYIQ